MSEVRYAIRQLRKSPGFTLVAILGLALGIGATVAFFSVVNSVFLRPLPYGEPDRLVRLRSTNEAQNLTRVGFSYSRYLAVQEQQQVFSNLALSIGIPFTLTGRGDPEQVIGLKASAALLPALGLQPAIGRNFSAAEASPGCNRSSRDSNQAVSSPHSSCCRRRATTARSSSPFTNSCINVCRRCLAVRLAHSSTACR